MKKVIVTTLAVIGGCISLHVIGCTTLMFGYAVAYALFG